eukprot:14510099-Ditylum_brightwellii.AAC.1
MIDCKHLTVCWHVDNLKVPHIGSKVVTQMLKWPEGKYRQLQTTKGKVHDYIRMMLDFQKKDKVEVIMANCVWEIIQDFPEVIQGIAATPAAEHLFE